MAGSLHSKRLPIAVLISGGGTTLRNLIERIEAGRLAADIRLVVSSNPQAGGIEFARKANIPTHVLERASYVSDADYGKAIFDLCRAAKVELVVLGGFLKLLAIPDDFVGRVMNIHPALIPNYCGRGYYGHRVHEAVLADKARQSGCTVHFVDHQYDHGPIILQKTVSVREGDTPDTLAARVFEAECEAYPEAIELFAAGRLKIVGNEVRILPG